MSEKLISIKQALLNMSTRIILLLFTFLMLTAVFFVVYTYQSNLSGMKKGEIEKLDAISKTLALQIDGDAHERLFDKYSEKDGIKNIEDDDQYYQIHTLLARTKAVNDLSTDIYTMVLKDGKQFEYGVSSSSGTYFRHVLNDLDDVSLNNYKIGGTLGPYNTVNGKWLSAFAPIKNRAGETVAIVQADQEFDSFIDKARAEITEEIGYVGVFLLGAFTIMFFYIRKILIREECLKKKMRHKNLIIEEKSRDLMDSINSAQKIQMAMFSVLADIKTSFPELFIMFEPRDVVSGDFFWFYKKGERSYFAVADCTGHGVPGAFMSMVGNTMLNDIINNCVNISPAEILTKLNQKVSSTLYKKDGTGTSDGMDIGLCCFNHKNGHLEYSGALRPLIHISGNELTKIGADRFAIGGHRLEEKIFTNKVVDVNAGDTIYMYSDGYHDQFGGSKGKKYQSKRFRELLMSANELHIEDQKYLLQYEFNLWKESEEQLDDVLVAGFKIPEMENTFDPQRSKMSA